MSGHTPGPWYVFSSRGVVAILDDRGDEIIPWAGFDAPSARGAKSLKRRRGNARLIAAAPELLAVAEFIVEHHCKRYPPELVMQAEYAVAKARGREGA